MARTAIVPVRLSKETHRLAHEACHANANNWNETVSWVRQMWADGYRPSERDIQDFAGAGSHPLHSQSLQAAGHDFSAALKTYRENRKNGLKARAPWREKKYRPLTWSSQGWRIRKGALILSMGKNAEPLILPAPEIVDARTGLPVPPSDWGSIKLCWDVAGKRWSLHVAYQTHAFSPLPQAAPGDPNAVTVAIDEGVIHAMALSTIRTDGTADVHIISGRKARDIKRHRNKQVASLRRKEAKLKQGSRKQKRLARKRGKIESKTKRQLRNFDHNVAAKAETFIRDQAVDKTTGEIRPVRIVIGDVRGIEKNTNKKRRSSRSTRQQLSQWGRGRQEQYLSEKTGITLEHINEAHTTQRCLFCPTLNKTSSRNYRCKNCRHELPRDAVGSLNINRESDNAGAQPPMTNPDRIRVTYQRAVEHHYPARPAVVPENRATTRKKTSPRGVASPLRVGQSTGRKSGVGRVEVPLPASA